MLRGAAFLMLVMLAQPLLAEDPPDFVLKWGSFCDVKLTPPCTGLLNQPYDIAVAPNGNIYVSDTLNHRIVIFDSNGNRIDEWGSLCRLTNDQFGCVDPDGGGPLALGDGQFWDPVGLIVAPNGDVYVTEWSNDRVQVFDSNGTFLRKWGTSGSSLGKFDTADDVAIDSNGLVYVVDKENHRVQRFTNTGGSPFAWGGWGSTNGKFKFPVGIAIDANDNIFVSEEGGNRIQVFDTNGVYQRQWGSSGNSPGEFNEPIHIGVDASGNVYVPDSENNRIQKFDNDGNFLSQWGTPCDVLNLGACDTNAPGAVAAGDGQFLEPEGVAVDAQGNIYVADTHNSRIQKFGTGGGGPGPGADCDCTQTPDDTAAFKIGTPRSAGANRIEVPLLVNTVETASFTQMTIEYDSACLTYVDNSAAAGADVTSPGPVFASAEAGAVDANSDYNLTVNGSGEYSGCDQEVFVVTFEFAGGTPPCDLVWDTILDGGNSNNKMEYSLTGHGTDRVVLPDDITFCDGQVEPLPCPICDNQNLPDIDTAAFKVGNIQVVGNSVMVPLIVDTQEDIKYTQMTIEYHSDCLVYDSTVLGADVTPIGLNPLTEFDEAGAVDGDSDRNLTLQLNGTYSGCDQQVFIVTFDFAVGFTLPCKIVFDPSENGPNSDNHLNYTIGVGGVDGKIAPPDITFCDGAVEPCDDDIIVSGEVTYYNGNEPIFAGTPDVGSTAVTVKDCNNANPTTTSASPDGAYSLSLGAGPLSIDLCADRDLAACGSQEDGVISGDDVILIQNHAADSNTYPFTEKQKLAGDVNGDDLGFITNDDVNAVKRWIARLVCNGTDACEPVNPQIKNCAGTWRFIFLTGAAPNGFEEDQATLVGLCNDLTLDIEGLLVGDVDGSWPQMFPKADFPVDLAFDLKSWEEDEVQLSLRADLDTGEALRHVIYSLDYDESQFEYLGMTTGSAARNWGALDNPQQRGVAHGIAHIPALAEPSSESGEIMVFRFRALNAQAQSRIGFSRLKANDVDIDVPELHVSSGGGTAAPATPQRFTLKSQPNPFNPSTTVHFSIPEDRGVVPVTLRVYDVSGRLVRTLLSGQRGPGFHQVRWNGISDAGQAVGAGLYVVRIQAGDWTSVEKLALIK